MRRWIIILLLLLAAAAVFLLGPLLSIGPARPFDSVYRYAIPGILVLVALTLIIASFRTRKTQQSTRAAFHATWRTVGLLGAPIAILSGLSIWVIESAYRDISDLAAEMNATLDDLRQLEPAVAFADLASTAEVLTRVHRFTRRDENALNLPLLDPETDRAYLVDHYELMVSNHLRPHLMQRLEAQITSNLGKPDALYAALKVYLMLGQEGPMDADYVLNWVEADLSERFQGAYNQQLREDLILHTATLLRSGRWNEYPVRRDLVADARARLAEMEPGQLLYYRIMSDPVIDTLADWRVSEAGGPATSRVFVRASGKSLDEPIPGIFTHQGFHEAFLPLLAGSTSLLERDDWIVGSGDYWIERTRSDDRHTINRVVDLYHNDFIAHWEGILRDLTLVPISSRTHLVEVLNILSGPSSPIRLVLRDAAEQTRLTVPLEREIENTAIDQKIREAMSLVSRMSRLSVLIDSRDRLDDLAVVPGAPVEERFRWLHDLFRGEVPDIETYMLRLIEIYRTMHDLELFATPQSTEIETAVYSLRAMRPSLPPVLDNWTVQLLGFLEGQTAGAMRANVNAKWQTDILPVCRRATDGTYPFDRNSPVDLPLADFHRLFGPGGLMDTFFNEFLAPYVDRGGQRWQWRSDAGFSDAALVMFQRAADIREAFFPSGGGLEIPFELSVVGLDPTTDYLAVGLGGDRVVYSHGAQNTTRFTWPFRPASAELEMGSDGQAHRIREEGVWAFFRLLDGLEAQERGQHTLRYVANIRGKLGVMEIRAPQAINPFSTPALTEFRCPLGF